MAEIMAVNVDRPAGAPNCYELLAWLNETLQTGFTTVEQVCTGAACCQLMHRLFPGSLDLSRVRFQSNNMVDFIHNYSLLQAALRKVGVVRYVPVESLMKRNRAVALSFLQWFKRFFDVNNNGREYHALEARGGQNMVPDSDAQHSQSSHQKLEIIVKMERVEKPKEDLNRNSEVIVLLSDDDDDVVEVKVEQKAEKMEVKEVCVQAQEVKTATPDAENQESRSDGRDALLAFIRRYCDSDTRDAYVSSVLSPSHPGDIIQACSHTPYCLYLYMRVELGGGRTTSVVLIGYFDQSSGVSAVKPLHALQMSTDTSADAAADDNDAAAAAVGPHAAYADSQLLIVTLKKLGLSLSNLSAFYCNAWHPSAVQVFVFNLRAFSPHLVSLCRLPGMAERACWAGLSFSSRFVVNLVKDIHHHYSTWPSVNDSLKELFADAESYDPSRPISAQCLFIINFVQKMARSWEDIVEYFKSLRQSKDADRIRAQLMDHKVQLYFLFLFHALEPLRALQVVQKYGKVDVAVELQVTSILLQSYATSLLQPHAVDAFLRRRSARPLLNKDGLLPIGDLDIGSRAREFLSATSFSDLGEQQRKDFLKDAATFYQVALQSLVESVPKTLGDVALRNISKILKHPESISTVKLSRLVISELAFQLGVSSHGSSEKHLLPDYLSAVKKLEEAGGGMAKMLDHVQPHSALHKLLLTLLALPSSLCRTRVFAEVFNSTEPPPDSEETSRPPPQPVRWAGRPRISRRKPAADAGYGGKKRRDEEDEESTSDDSDVDSFTAQPGFCLPSRRDDDADDSDRTDNSSDVVDVTEEPKMCRIDTLTTTKSPGPPQAESIYIVGEDDEDEDVEVDVDDGVEDEDDSMVSGSTPDSSGKLRDVKGELVWGQVAGFSPWPAVIKGGTEGKSPGKAMVEWYGQKMSTQVSLQSLKPFSAFAQHFCSKSFAILATYREAIFLSLQEAALRCGKQFSARLDDRDELLKHMLDWAFGGFQPRGPDGLKPGAARDGVTKTNDRPMAKKKLFLKADSSRPSPPAGGKPSPKGGGGKSSWEDMNGVGKEKRSRGGWEGWRRGRGRGGWKGGRVQKKKSSLVDGFDDDMSPDFVPNKRRTYTKTYNKVNESSDVYTQPDQRLREETICVIMKEKTDIDSVCLCCATDNVEIFHPLFKGSLCLKCKNNLTETLYRYDDDGYQSYCTICCYGLEVILCGNDSCCRSYCADCLNILVGPGTFDSLKQLDPWICYLCQPHRPHGALIPREDWSIRVQGMFANNSAMEFEPHRVYPSISANLRRPLRVLSLFDGIATGYLVLKELGFKVEKYVASEVCEDSVAVSTINHDGKIVHVGDVRLITQEHIEQWGPFDLLIGGSPCNDLSIVNPIRKGLYEGTGRLFFEYYRILQLLKPKEEDPRPFFWLFENVVFMNTHDKVNICRFLECNPVLVDAVRVSPAHRARYFWGNIPGMSRPIIASQSDKLSLQDCLEIGREARVTKVRTITTNPNSLKQGKDVNLLPVIQNGKEDNLWITELEKIFGFPKHYTDVRNMNRQQRQKVLGKAWSVPVIRHLFAPLKDYFACEELPPLTFSTTSNSCMTSSNSPMSSSNPMSSTSTSSLSSTVPPPSTSSSTVPPPSASTPSTSTLSSSTSPPSSPDLQQLR